MQAVLWDMMRADQFLGDFVLKKDSGPDNRAGSIKLYRQVFDLHHISKEQFGESFSFYKSHPVLFKVIMDSISRPRPEAPTEVISRPMPPDSFQPSRPGTVKTDTLMPLRRKKVIP